MTNGGTAGGLSVAAPRRRSSATRTSSTSSTAPRCRIARPASGSWPTAIKKARKYTDKNGQYLWQPAIAAGQPATFDGNAVYEDPYLAAPASATKSVVFGDVSGVLIKQMALRVATSGDYRFNTDQIALKTVYRAGGALPDVLSLRYLVSANT
jgi:predicted phage gp36 major capsid-like protein